MKLSRLITPRIRHMAAASVAAMLLQGAAAQAGQISPQTKLKVTVVQWMPTKGVYDQWDALGGEFTVASDGSIALPVVGSMAASGMDSARLADAIAAKLQSGTGLVARPNVTVEIIEYPPIYVVGDVTKAGEYPFREGLTVLHALALGGGERYSDEHAAEQVRLAGELRALDEDLARQKARIARLEAENAGSAEIAFPDLAPADKTKAGKIRNWETVIFEARKQELARQVASYGELRKLLEAEISALEQKGDALDDSIKAVEKELAGVSSLVKKGISVASRENELGRTLASLRAERLDQVTAIMRAQQGITEANRNLDAVRDKRRTEAATELQTEQSSFAQTQVKHDMTQKLLLDLLATTPVSDSNGRRGLAFSITRAVKGKPGAMAASESDFLQPGDVVNVRIVASE